MADELTTEQNALLQCLCEAGQNDIAYLRAILKQAMAMLNAIPGAGGSSITVVIGGGVERTITSSVETDATNSPVAAGAKSVSFIFSSDFAGSVNGATIDPAVTGSKAFNAPGPDTLPAIAYTCSAGSVTIDVMT